MMQLLVSIGVGLEGAGIDDSFVIHQAIPFVLGLSQQGVVGWVANNLISFCHLYFPWFGTFVTDPKNPSSDVIVSVVSPTGSSSGHLIALIIKGTLIK